MYIFESGFRMCSELLVFLLTNLVHLNMINLFFKLLLVKWVAEPSYFEM